MSDLPQKSQTFPISPQVRAMIGSHVPRSGACSGARTLALAVVVRSVFGLEVRQIVAPTLVTRRDMTRSEGIARRSRLPAHSTHSDIGEEDDPVAVVLSVKATLLPSTSPRLTRLVGQLLVRWATAVLAEPAAWMAG